MLDTCATSPMTTPRSVTQHGSTSKARRRELTDTSVSTVGEHTAVLLA
jgi:hypothetical protein